MRESSVCCGTGWSNRGNGIYPEDLGTPYHNNNIIINVERRPRDRDKHIGLMLRRIYMKYALAYNNFVL